MKIQCLSLLMLLTASLSQLPPALKAADGSTKTRIVNLDELLKKWERRGITEIRQAAGSDPEARFVLGYLMSHDPNSQHFAPEEGLKHLKQAAANGIVNAQLELGLLYRRTVFRGGTGIAEHAEAEKWYRLAAKNGMPEGLTAIGQMILSEELPGSREDAEKLFRQAAEAGDVNGAIKLVSQYLESPAHVKVEEAYAWLDRSMRNDPKKTVEYLDDLIGSGRWPDPRWTGARRVVRLGAENGSAHCQYQLGVMLADGIDGPADLEKATQWLAKADQQKQFKAARALGRVYGKMAETSSETAVRDRYFRTAFEWFKKATSKNDARAGLLLAQLVLRAQPDNPENRKHAEAWFKWVAQFGIAEALIELKKLNPEAASEVARSAPAAPVNFSALVGCWEGDSPTLGAVRLRIQANPRGTFTTHLTWTDRKSGRRLTEARHGPGQIPGLVAGEFRIAESADGQLVAILRNMQARLKKESGDDVPGRPFEKRVLGDWSGKWPNGQPFKLTVHEGRFSRYPVEYRYSREPDSKRVEQYTYSCALQKFGILPYTNPGKSALHYRIEADPTEPDRIMIAGRYPFPMTRRACDEEQ